MQLIQLLFELQTPTNAPFDMRDVLTQLAHTLAERRASMTWAQRLKRVFNIDIETCRECGGAMKVIACIEDPVVIQKILNQLAYLGKEIRS